jgi:hypothetical protein
MMYLQVKTTATLSQNFAMMEISRSFWSAKNIFNKKNFIKLFMGFTML